MQYKKIRKLTPYCSVCNKEIIGNGSAILPYRCDCGEYKFDSEKKDYILANH